jgi:hypothetical protein
MDHEILTCSYLYAVRINTTILDATGILGVVASGKYCSI